MVASFYSLDKLPALWAARRIIGEDPRLQRAFAFALWQDTSRLCCSALEAGQKRQKTREGRRRGGEKGGVRRGRGRGVHGGGVPALVSRGRVPEVHVVTGDARMKASAAGPAHLRPAPFCWSRVGVGGDGPPCPPFKAFQSGGQPQVLFHAVRKGGPQFVAGRRLC